jgi:hypothetical protein
MTEKEILLVFEGMSEDSREFEAMKAVMVAFMAQELDAGIMPGLSDSERHYNAGRAASAKDLVGVIGGLWDKAHQPKKG